MGEEPVGIYAVSLADKTCVSVLPGVGALMNYFSPDGEAILYEVQGAGETTIYRLPWHEGKAGQPTVALKLPFSIPVFYLGNASDFSRDLATVVFARPWGQAELYHVSSR